MATKYTSIKKSALKNIAEQMCIAARTAPKAKGTDNLEILILTEKDKKKVISRMKTIAKRDSKPSCKRDADNIKTADYVIVIGTKIQPLGINCGFCGYTSCKELSKTKGVCTFNSMDLGIALGSAASLAGRMHVDNRLMYSIGKATIECKLFSSRISQAIGIPVSATGKNQFFDRK